MDNIIFDNIAVHYSGKGYFDNPHQLLKEFKILPDRVEDYFNSDFYGFGLTRQDNLNKQGVLKYHKYQIEGVVEAEGKPILSTVFLLTQDLKHIKAMVTDKNGTYKFENIPYEQYTIIAYDFTTKYNASIQVGVKPVEIV